MIAKKYRLTEKETKRVLQKWKPFFSYGIVLNYMPNRIWNNRFAIVIWKKSVKNNIIRNFIRRKFYDLVFDKIIQKKGFDMVFVVKKQTKFEKNDLKSILNFEKDIQFLLNKIK